MTDERKTYLDILRIAAAVFVVAIHVINSGADASAGADRVLLIALHTLVRTAVPIFVMISGSLWLDPERNVGAKRVAKGIARLACAFVVWSAFYAVVQTKLLEGASLKKAAVAFITGPEHMWFIFMMACLYLLVPILRKVAESRALVGYFAILAVVFTFILPFTLAVLGSDVLYAVNNKLHFSFTLGFVSYFMIGRFLASADLRRWARYVIYALGIAAFAASVLMTVWLETESQQFRTVFINPEHPFVLMQAAALFTFGRYALSKPNYKDRTRRALRAVAGCTFGVYLVHPIVIEVLRRVTHLEVTSFSAAVTVPAAVLIVFAVSLGISALIRRIPVLKNYIV